MARGMAAAAHSTALVHSGHSSCGSGSLSEICHKDQRAGGLKEPPLHGLPPSPFILTTQARNKEGRRRFDSKNLRNKDKLF